MQTKAPWSAQKSEKKYEEALEVLRAAIASAREMAQKDKKHESLVDWLQNQLTDHLASRKMWLSKNGKALPMEAKGHAVDLCAR